MKQNRNDKESPQELEVKYYGVNACQLLYQKRPQAIIRVYVVKERMGQWGNLLKWAAAQRKAYHVVSADDMEKIAAGTHHEGVCILAKMPETLNDRQLLDVFGGVKTESSLNVTSVRLLYLDGVANPHNFGALLRVASHFGVTHVLGAAGHLPQLSSSALRIAEGGAESLKLVYLQQVESTLIQLKKLGFRILATSSHKGTDLYRADLPARALFILGAEHGGVSESLLKLADITLAIPGTGNVESLNVATASAVLLAEHWRQYIHRQ